MRTMRAHTILPFLIASFCTPAVLGWGTAGHEIVATIAQIHLHPSVFPNICTILNFTSTNPNEPLCHLAPIATWADRIRFKMRWSAALHYIGALDDHPSQTCLFPGERGWAGKRGGNVLGAVKNVTDILEDWVGDEKAGLVGADDRANEALKFLVHFLGDMHQPLHLTGRDRGGNSVKVLFDGRHTNLHSLWDSLLIAKALRTVPRNYSHPLPSQKIEHALRGTIYDSYVRRIMWEGVLGKWKEEIPSWLSCPAATPSSSTGVGAGMWQQVMSIWARVAGGGAEETDDGLLCPHYWAEPIHALNCEIVWPKAIDEPPYSHTDRLYRPTSPCASSSSERLSLEQELAMVDEMGNYIGSGDPAPGGPYLELDTPEYTGVISKQWLIERLLAQGGVRLAGVLNWLFADFEDGEGVVGNRGLRVVDI